MLISNIGSEVMNTVESIYVRGTALHIDNRSTGIQSTERVLK